MSNDNSIANRNNADLHSVDVSVYVSVNVMFVNPTAVVEAIAMPRAVCDLYSV